MTKAPRPGTVKTRLQPPLSPEEAAQLNVCFLRDIAAAIVSAGGESKGVGVFTPVGCEENYLNILPSAFVLIPQRGDSFGERLMNAATDLLSVGFESCCLINSDSPTVTADAFRQAMVKLQGADNRIVLGPSDDGGYYLIGMRKAYRRLFEDIENQKELIQLLGLAEAGEGVRIYIGSENKLFSLSGSSMIAAPFRDSSQKIVGVLGVIGPTRLNYARVVPMVDYTAKVVGRLLNR